MMEASPLVSVVVPTHNRREDLHCCLEHLFKQTYPLFEVLVVDDASTDGTREMLASEFPKVFLFVTSNRGGVCVTRNIGLQNANGQYIWFLDSDSIVENVNCMQNMVELMQNSPSIGSIGGEIIRRADKRYCRRLKFLFFEDAWEENDFLDRKMVYDCDYLPTCNCFVRRDPLRGFVFFNGGNLFGSEDADLGYFLKENGYRNIMRYDTLVFHSRSGITRTATFDLFFRAKGFFILKNYGLFVFFLYPIIEGYNLFCSAFASLRLSPTEVKSDSAGGGFIRMGLRYVASFIRAYWSILVNLRTSRGMLGSRKSQQKNQHSGLKAGDTQ